MKKFLAMFLVIIVAIALVFPASITASSPSEYIKIMARSDVKVTNIANKLENAAKSHFVFQPQQFTPLTGFLRPVKKGGKRYAIIIGSNYSSIPDDTTMPPFVPPLSPHLKWAENDATAMAGLFQGYGFDTIIPLIGIEANKANILKAIKEARKITGDRDEIVFYFAGHGAEKIQSLGKRNEVVAEGIVTDEGNDVDYLWDNDLARSFRDFETNRIIFIFDSCFSGGMTEVGAPGRLVLSATTKDGLCIEDAAEGPNNFGFNHGLFTFFLLAALSGNAAQASQFVDTILSIYGFETTDNPYEPSAYKPVSVEQVFDYSSYEIKEISDLVLIILEGSYGQHIASYWNTPVISDWFIGDLGL